MSLQDWYVDVWAEILSVGHDSMSFAWLEDGQVRTRRESFAVVNSVQAVLPGDVHHVYLLEGLYGAHKAATLTELPDRIQQAAPVEKNQGYMKMMDAIRIQRIKTDDPKPGDFVNLSTWCGDVWAEVESVFHSGENPGIVIYHQRDSRKDTEYTHFSYISKVRAYLPADANIVYLKEGTWGGRKGDLAALPERIKRGPRDYTPKPVVTTPPAKKPRNRFLKAEAIQFQITHQAVLSTNAFDGLRSETAEQLGDKVLSLPFVKGVDWMHGNIEVELTDPTELPQLEAVLKKCLSAKL